jgi:hypothetical protein
MNVKQTGILAVLALAAMGATAFSMRAGTQGFATDRRGETIFPNIVSRLNDVASISIRDHEKTFTVEKRADGFVDKDSGYPIKGDQFRDLAVGIAMLAYEETKTATPARYRDLGLAEPGGAPDTVGRQVTLRDGRGAVMANVIVGNRDATVGGARGGLYLRLPDQTQTWVARGDLRVPAPHAAWFEINITNIGRDALADIKISGGGLEEIAASAEKKGDDLKLLNAPEDKAPDSSKIMRLSFMVDPISFQDVRKHEGTPAADGRRMVVTSRNGVRISYATIGKLADGWVRFTVEAISDEGRDEAATLKSKMEGYDFKLATNETEMLGWELKDVTTEPKK